MSLDGERDRPLWSRPVRPWPASPTWHTDEPRSFPPRPARTLAHSAGTDGPPARAPGRAAPVHQARRLHGSGHRRQQDAQARVPVGRGRAPGRRYAADPRRRAVQPRAADGRRGRLCRPAVRSPARSARGRCAGRVRRLRQRVPRQAVRHPAAHGARRHRDGRRPGGPGDAAAGPGPQALRDPGRRLQCARLARLCRLRARTGAAVPGPGPEEAAHRACHGQRRHPGRASWPASMRWGWAGR
jgi:hypothetical protein